LFKTRATELHTRIYNLITKGLGRRKDAFCFPIRKKPDKALCTNYRVTALLYVVYEVFSKIIRKRLEPSMGDIVGNYQAGFRRNKSTTDHSFAMKQIIEKCYAHDTDIHCIFIDFKQAFDSINRK
jgi:hypothetical protein